MIEILPACPREENASQEVRDIFRKMKEDGEKVQMRKKKGTRDEGDRANDGEAVKHENTNANVGTTQLFS